MAKNKNERLCAHCKLCVTTCTVFRLGHVYLHLFILFFFFFCSAYKHRDDIPTHGRKKTDMKVNNCAAVILMAVISVICE